MPNCPGCGENHAGGARFCSHCGRALVALGGPRRAERRTVTVLFSDVRGFTALGERLDPEALGEVMLRYFARMKEAVLRHGGTVRSYTGDAVLAVFGMPWLHEDDALRALRCAFDMERALGDLNDSLQATWGVELTMRVGVNTGEVLAGEFMEGEPFLMGDPVNVAARLQQEGEPGLVVVGEATRRLLGDGATAEALPPLAVRGRAAPVTAYRITALAEEADRERRGGAAFVGRSLELGTLRALAGECLAGRRAVVATVVGAAGVGKSRLAAELLESLPPGSLVARGRCLSYGAGATYRPLAVALQGLAGIAPGDPPDVVERKLFERLGAEPRLRPAAERLTALMGLRDLPVTAADLTGAFRSVLERLGREGMGVLVVDDLQWAEPALLDLLDGATAGLAAPALVLCLARPELDTVHPAWSTGSAEHRRLELPPLPAVDASDLAATLLPGDAWGPARKLLIATTGGNPLFVEELARMLRERDAPPSQGSMAMPMPPTIEALLRARLESLPRDWREVAATAAVIGEEFDLDSLVAIVGDHLKARLPDCLQGLAARELVRPPDAAEGARYAFHHLLVRDAGYASLTKQERAALHQRLADWIETTTSGRPGEPEELLAHHLAQAWRNRVDLGLVDPATADLAIRAAARLTSAGRHARGRADAAATAGLLGRAAEILPQDSAARAQVLSERARALFESGAVEAARATIAEATALAARLGDAAVVARAEVERLDLMIQMTPDLDPAGATRSLTRHIRTLTTAGDDVGLARAWALRSGALSRQARWPVDVQERALHHARLAGSAPDVHVAMRRLISACYWGPMPAPEAARRLESFAAEAGSDTVLEVQLASRLAGTLALMDRPTQAMALLTAARQTLDHIGNLWLLADFMAWSARASANLGDLPAAEAAYRESAELYGRLGETSRRSTVFGDLADVICRAGRPEAAIDLARECAALAGAHDVNSHALAHSVTARFLALRGEHEPARAELARALRLVTTSDMLEFRGHLQVARAEVAAAAGLVREEEQARAAARRLYRRKGATALLRRVSAGLPNR